MDYVITQISQAKRNSERVNLYLSGSFWLALSKNDMISLKLMKDKVLTQQEKEKIEGIAATNKLLERAFRFVSLRPRSVFEVREYLIYRKKYTEEESEQTIKKLRELQLLSDKRFAEWYVLYKSSTGIHGQNKLKAEMRAKGVPLAIITSVLSKFTNATGNIDAQQEKLYEFTKKLLKNTKAKSTYELKQKIMNRLIGRGFTFSEVKAVLKELVDNQKV